MLETHAIIIAMRQYMLFQQIKFSDEHLDDLIFHKAFLLEGDKKASVTEDHCNGSESDGSILMSRFGKFSQAHSSD